MPRLTQITDNERNAYSDMLAMLDRIHVMIEYGEDVNSAGLFDEIGCLIAQARGEYVIDGETPQ